MKGDEKGKAYLKNQSLTYSNHEFITLAQEEVKFIRPELDQTERINLIQSIERKILFDF